jgi:hypothetical protein
MKMLNKIFYSDKALCTARGIVIGLVIASIIVNTKK